MNLRSIEYFLITAEELNVTRAAERLYISQQALSSHIKRLEDEYQVQLFSRRPSFHLTPEGEQMLFYGKQILASEAKLRAAFSDIKAECRGTLKVGISRLRGDVFFPLIWKFYHPSHPNISIELIDGKSTYLEELLQTGKLDLYIGIDIPSNPNQERIELAREKIQCCFSDDLLKQYYPDSWQDMLQKCEHGVDLLEFIALPFITLRQGNRLRTGIDQFFARHAKPRFAFECDQQGLAYELAQSGAGAGLLSPVIIYQHRHDKNVQDDSFHVFPVRNDLPENVVSMAYRNDYPLPSYAMDFIKDACLVFRSYSRSISKNFSG